MKKIREENGLTQGELAEMVGISQPMIAQYEMGIKLPNIVIGKEIAKKLMCSLDRLAE
ncbi:MAG: helix-turn-helix transcriptional regulator [Ruminococcus sp.]|nr:helix-turn-helix transcriptional regulator [Ruminococcus sp.]